MTHHDLFAHNGGREGHPRAACQSVPKLRTADALDEQCRSVPAPLATRWVEIPQENPSPCKAGNAQNSRIMVKPPANEGETTKLVKDTGQTTPTLCRPLEPRNRAEVAKDVKSQEMPRLRSARHQENKNSQDSAPPAFAWQRTATPPHQPQQLVPKQSPQHPLQQSTQQPAQQLRHQKQHQENVSQTREEKAWNAPRRRGVLQERTFQESSELSASLPSSAPRQRKVLVVSPEKPDKKAVSDKDLSCSGSKRVSTHKHQRASLGAATDSCKSLLRLSEQEKTKPRGDSAPPRPRPSRPRRQSLLKQQPPSPTDDGPDLTIGEDWPTFLSRASARFEALGIEDDAPAIFEVFRVADDLGLAYAAFARLFHLATAPFSHGGHWKTDTPVAPPWAPEGVSGRKWRFPYEPIRLMLGGNWKAKKLWKLLDERCNRPDYEEAPCGEGGRLDGRRALIVGAGPCGLRAAVELRLLGAQVTVVERREQFSRINQLHLWDWCCEELKLLGARCLEPPPNDFGADPDLLHISINDLQKLLLKVALLLGAEVLLGVDYVTSIWDGSGWAAQLRPSSVPNEAQRTNRGLCAEFSVLADGPPSPRAPFLLRDVGLLMGASGFGCSIGSQAGMNSLETDHLRKDAAIGLICNFARIRGAHESRLRSFAMARQFYGKTFEEASSVTGADLENIVYTKSHTSHYFVMTPSRDCLVHCGVIRNRNYQPTLAPENIDNDKLDAFVRRITAFPFSRDREPVFNAISADCGFREPHYADNGPRLFDFSRMRRSVEGISFVDSPLSDGPNGDDASALFVALIGDALIEPFWPEGLGIVRGFFSVLDACYAAAQWSSGRSRPEVLQQAAEAYTVLKTLNASTRAGVLQNDESQYGLQPSSRYRPHCHGNRHNSNVHDNLSATLRVLPSQRSSPLLTRGKIK